MMAGGFRVGIVGTFDVENYGDLLFPLIAESELRRRLERVDVVPFSYGAKSVGEWPFRVVSLEDLPRTVAELDALLIGGGWLIRFDKTVAPGYGPLTAQIHHPTGYWLSPALIAQQHGVPVVWNAPGANYGDIADWADPITELALSLSSYIAVRDDPSRSALERFAGANAIEVVPDTAFGVGALLPAGPSFEFSRLRDANGLRAPYIVIQAYPGLHGLYAFLRRHEERLRRFRLLLLPISPIHGEINALPEADLPELVRLTAWPNPVLLAEIIRGAEAVLGPSYHLAATALTAGVPVFSFVDLTSGKFAGLAAFDGIYPLPMAPDENPEPFFSRLGKRPVSARANEQGDRLAAHWDRIAELVRSGRTESALGIGRFWQSLPGILEGYAARSDATLESLSLRPPASAASESGPEPSPTDSRVAELRRLLELARTEIVARDRRIAQLLDSTSWRASAPIRFIGRRLGR